MHHLHPLLLHGRCAANGGPSHGRHHRQAAHGAAGSAARHPAAPGPGRGGTAQGGIRGAGSAGQQEVCFHAGFTNHGSRPNDCDHRERLSWRASMELELKGDLVVTKMLTTSRRGIGLSGTNIVVAQMHCRLPAWGHDRFHAMSTKVWRQTTGSTG